jgi:hypothetical protein
MPDDEQEVAGPIDDITRFVRLYQTWKPMLDWLDENKELIARWQQQGKELIASMPKVS